MGDSLISMSCGQSGRQAGNPKLKRYRARAGCAPWQHSVAMLAQQQQTTPAQQHGSTAAQQLHGRLQQLRCRGGQHQSQHSSRTAAWAPATLLGRQDLQPSQHQCRRTGRPALCTEWPFTPTFPRPPNRTGANAAHGRNTAVSMGLQHWMALPAPLVAAVVLSPWSLTPSRTPPTGNRTIKAAAHLALDGHVSVGYVGASRVPAHHILLRERLLVCTGQRRAAGRATLSA